MAEVMYTSYACGEMHEQELILIYDRGKKFGIASCPKDDLYFTVPARLLEQDLHWKIRDSVVISTVSNRNISILIKEIERNQNNGSSVVLSSDLVSEVLFR